MRGFTITTEIDAPASRVWIVMSDVDRWHEWTPSIRSVQRIGGQPLGIGARALIRQPKFPRALTRGISERYVRLEAQGLKARSENSAFRHGSSLTTR